MSEITGTTTGKLVEIISPFGSRRIPIEEVDWDAVKRMRAFYASPEGQKVLDDYEEDERYFREVRRNAEMPVSSNEEAINRTVFVRVINEVGQVLVPYLEEGDEENVCSSEPDSGGGSEVRN